MKLTESGMNDDDDDKLEWNVELLLQKETEMEETKASSQATVCI